MKTLQVQNSDNLSGMIINNIRDNEETPCEMLNRVGDDGMKWAIEFCKTAKQLGYGDIDINWVFVWFANAIEHSNDVRRWGNETGKIYDWMNERNLKWPLDKDSKMLFELTWE
jgi:hypothetical protein